jgi:hypothetical protein
MQIQNVLMFYRIICIINPYLCIKVQIYLWDLKFVMLKIMKKNVLWNLITDYTVFSDIWCQTTEFCLGCATMLHSMSSIMWGVMSDYTVSPCRRQISPQIYLHVSGSCYLLKDSLLTGFHNIYLNIRQYPSKNCSWKEKIFQKKCCNIFLEVIT